MLYGEGSGAARHRGGAGKKYCRDHSIQLSTCVAGQVCEKFGILERDIKFLAPNFDLTTRYVRAVYVLYLPF